MSHVCAHGVHMYLPIMVCGCQDNRGAGVCIASDPGTVDCKQYHEHHHKENNYSTQVAVSKVTRCNCWVNVLLLLSSFGVFVLCTCVCVCVYVKFIRQAHP